jgi:hypothetical protein
VGDRLLRAHRAIPGMVSLSGRITHNPEVVNPEVVPLVCRSVDVRLLVQWRDPEPPSRG